MQTTVKSNMDIALEGQLADLANKYAVSRLAEGGAIQFGRAVVVGTDKDGQAKLPSATGQVLAGVTIHEHAEGAGDNTGVKEKAAASVLRRGRIYVKVDEAVAPGDPVYFRYDAGKEGTFRKSAQDAMVNVADQIAAAAWGSVAGAGELAVLEINLP